MRRLLSLLFISAYTVFSYAQIGVWKNGKAEYVSSYESIDSITLGKDGCNGFVPSQSQEGVPHSIRSKTLLLGHNLLSYAVKYDGWEGGVLEGFTASGSVSDLIFDYVTEAGKQYVVVAYGANIDTNEVYASIGKSPEIALYREEHPYSIAGFKSTGGQLRIRFPYGYPTGKTFRVELRELLSDPNNAEVELTLAWMTDNVDNGSMQSDLSGFWNIAIGSGNTGKENLNSNSAPLASNQNGSRNIAIGTYALPKMISGTRNIAIGTYSLRKLTVGERNVSIGADAMALIENGEDNVAIGMTAIGPSANGWTTKSNIRENVAIGTYAGNGMGNESSQNVEIGHRSGAGSGRGTVEKNTSIGSFSGYKAGSGNVSVGYKAGYKAGKNNVAVGSMSGAQDKILNNTIAIGTNATPEKDGQAVIGGSDINETVLQGDVIIIKKDSKGNARRIKLSFNNVGFVTWKYDD